MKRKLVFSVLGTGLVVALFRAIAKECQKLVAQDAMGEFWRWLSGVMGDYTLLSEYSRDERTFGNSVWDHGVDKALRGLEHRLLHFPEDQLKSYNPEFGNQCYTLRMLALMQVTLLKSCFHGKDREDLDASCRLLGETVGDLHTLGKKKRNERMLAGVG